MEKDEIKKLDRQHVIYPWKAQRVFDPIVLERAQGIHFWDADGKRYIDFCAGLLCINIGHGNQHVLNAMKSQMAKFTYVPPSFATEAKARCARMISEVTPGDLDHVFFSNAGAEAIENAIKAVYWAMQVFGGYGYAKEYDIERWWREVNLIRLAPVTQQMTLSYIGEHVLGMPRSYF